MKMGKISIPITYYLLPITFLLLAGCKGEKRVMTAERSDGQYKAAMADYAAGRLDKSIEGFEKLLAKSPGNASARFQLACLLQDHRKDPLGAICNYREYVAMMPNGDKVAIAKDRMRACERQLAINLMREQQLGGSVQQDEQIAKLRADKAALEKEMEEVKKGDEKLKADIAALQRENDRIRQMIIAGAEDESIDAVALKGKGIGNREQGIGKDVASVKPPSEKDLLDEDDVTGMDRIKFSEDVSNLIAEEKTETSEPAPFGKTVKREQAAPVEEVKEPPHEPRPKEYVVQEGDTLFKLAMRFYGRRSAWTLIRDANKATVSSDGRIRQGQTLVFP